MTGVFTPTESSNTLWFDENMEDCLTAHIEGIEDDVAALQTGKANTIHTHSTYADLDHTHNNYALATHTHNEYATTNHTHTGYAASSHTHSYNDLTDKPTIPTALPANGGNADTVDGKHASDFADAAHTHTASEIGALSASLTIPTKTSQLVNDSGFKTTDNNTTYTLTKSGSMIVLSGSDGTSTFISETDVNIYIQSTAPTNVTDGALWVDTSADSMIGLPQVTDADNGKILKVVNGQWTLVAN